MGTTPNLALPFPELDDPADVPSDVEGLATSIDTVHGGGIIPIGGMVMWLLPTPPSNWLIANGNPIPAEYPLLIAKIGANLPDMRDLVPLGASATRAVGSPGGEARVKLKAAEGSVPVHGHLNSFNVAPQPAFLTTADYAWPAAPGWNAAISNGSISEAQPLNGYAGVAGTISSPATGSFFGTGDNWSYTGGVHSHVVPQHGHVFTGGVTNHAGADAVQDHNNIQPYRAVNYIIRAA